MQSRVVMIILLACLLTANAETFPRFLQGHRVRCIDQDSPDANDPGEHTVQYWMDHSTAGDVIVSFLDDKYYIDFDGKSNQPVFRDLLAAGLAGYIDHCVLEAQYDIFTKDRTSAELGSVPDLNSVEAGGGIKSGYSSTTAATLDSNWDISSCNIENNYAIKNMVYNSWATSLQECHETLITFGTDFGNFEKCWVDCAVVADAKDVSTEARSRMNGVQNKITGEIWISPGSCPSKCNNGICCREGYASLEYCHVGTDMGTFHHHGCVPPARSLKTCKCQEMTDPNFYVQENGIRRACLTCTPPLRGGCSDTVCQKCAQKDGESQYPVNNTCQKCSEIHKSLSSSCDVGSVHAFCSTDSLGSCGECNPNFYTEPGVNRHICQNCTVRSETECIVADATLLHCDPGPGYCACNPGFTPTDPSKAVSSTNPCVICPNGEFKSDVSNDACQKCGTGDVNGMNSLEPRINYTDCTCWGIPNRKEMFRPADGTGDRECRQCKYFSQGYLKPYKPANETECKGCDPGYWFGQATENSEFACIEIPIMNLKCDQGDPASAGQWFIENRKDQYRHPQLMFKPSSTGNFVPDNHYLDLNTFQIHSCSGVCTSFQYPHLCGQPIGNEIYVLEKSTNTEEILTLNSVCDTTQETDYEIIRTGSCKSCSTCNPGFFNNGCKDGTETINPCVSCTATCTSGYLSHDLERGCDDPQAMSDHICESCQKVKQDGNNYFIVESCGGHDYDRWNVEDNEIVKITCTTTTDLCDFTNVNVNGHLIPRTNHKGTMLPYCPPKYHVDTDCFNNNLATWKSECCIPCQSTMPEQRKTSDHLPCSGKTSEDTQTWTDRCDNNYYLNENLNTCVACETCR